MPTRRAPARAAVLALLGVLLTCGVAWAQPSGVVVSEGTLDGRARLVVSGDGPIAVTVAGQPQPITTTPLVSDRTAMALVVDASAEGGPGLQPGLGGLVDFALAVPPVTRTAVVTDTAPPAVVVPLQAGPAGVLTGLSGITSRGDRQTGGGAGSGRRAAAAGGGQPAAGGALHGRRGHLGCSRRPRRAAAGPGRRARRGHHGRRGVLENGRRRHGRGGGGRPGSRPSSPRSGRSRARCARGRW